MNFDKGHNVFSDIPGFDASKGERIVKALQKLWKKIEYLEQIRISERKSKSKEELTSSRDADLTITDVQYKLLVLQLQYVRSILRQKLDKSSVVFHPKKFDDKKISPDKNADRNTEMEDFHRTVISQETQTGSSLIDGWNQYSEVSVSRSVKKSDAQITAIDSQLSKCVGPFDCSSPVIANVPQSTSKPSSKPHYHLKLDDVPFILGASSTASHSVVANVQNIIAMMKSHNKALCGPKQRVSRLPINSHITSGNTQDATKMLNELSRDLYELALKQEKLVKRFDLAHRKDQASNLTKNSEETNTSKVNKPVNMKNIAVDGTKRCRSNSDSSIKLHAEVKNFSTIKEKDVDYSAQQKQNLTNMRSQPSNPPLMARRKLLRSLQNFKTHLSEEDISWD